MRLHLGVIDQPYNQPPLQGNRPRQRPPDQKTTGDVAEILEDKYHVMRIFFEERQAQIVALLEDGLKDRLESLLVGAPMNASAFAEAESKIKSLFDEFITLKQMDSLGYPGVPTAAALRGVNHRMKHPYAKRDPRPSFVDTGLYLSSFIAWMEDQDTLLPTAMG